MMGFSIIEKLEGEIWKDSPRYKGIIQVSNRGRVKQLGRLIYRNAGTIVLEEKILKVSLLGVSPSKYCYVQIRLDNGSRKYERVCNLVAESFLPNPDHQNIN